MTYKYSYYEYIDYLKQRKTMQREGEYSQHLSFYVYEYE